MPLIPDCAEQRDEEVGFVFAVAVAVGQTGGRELRDLSGEDVRIVVHAEVADIGLNEVGERADFLPCLLYTSPSPRD